MPSAKPQVIIRADQAEKDAWALAAKRANVAVSVWARAILNREAEVPSGHRRTSGDGGAGVKQTADAPGVGDRPSRHRQRVARPAASVARGGGKRCKGHNGQPPAPHCRICGTGRYA